MEAMMSDTGNRIRFYHFIAGVLENQQKDPLCSICKAFANTARAMNEGICVLEREVEAGSSAHSADLRDMLAKTRKRLAAIKASENSIGQKKAGNCRMPEGVCFVKASKGIQERIT